jgi:hypothetical protein
MCFEKYGTSASKWAMGKASNFNIVRLAGTWIFFRCGHEKMLKTDVLHKTLISRNLLKEKNIQDRTMWKLTSRAFRKCGTYWACEVLNGSYCCSKSEDCEILAPSPFNFFLKFDPTLTANNYGLKPLKLENYHIFGMVWTSAFTWYHPR